MKKNMLVFGLIAGVLISAMMVFSTSRCYVDRNFEASEVVGYASMLISFSLIFVGVRNYRDKYNEGMISFGKAFRAGLYITLIASIMYVVVWLVHYYVFIPDFMDRYSEYLLTKNAGQPDAQEKAADLENFRVLYRNPLFVILMTFLEVFPIGVIISLISALILKKKNPEVPAPSAP